MYMRIALAIAVAIVAAGCKRHRTAPVTEIVLDKDPSSRLTQGIYPGKDGWRWTARSFVFYLDPPETTRARYLELDLAVTTELMENAAAVTLSATVNGVDLGSQIYVEPGRYLFTRYVPDNALTARPAKVQFWLDRSFQTAEGRETGVIAVAAGLKEYEQTREFLQAQEWAARQTATKTNAELAKIPPAKAVELRKLFFATPGIRNVEFQGIRVGRNPLDLWMMEQAAFAIRPQFVIETGAGEGGPALYWAHTLHGLDLTGAKVLAVSRKNLAQKAAQQWLWAKYVEPVEGDPTAPELIAKLAARTKGTATLVVLDAGEEIDRVYDQLMAYAPLVSRGSYMIVARTESFALPEHKTGAAGPSEAIRRFLAQEAGKNFEIDRDRDVLFLTSSPGGWLKRK